MPPKKRTAAPDGEPVAKRRSSRQAAAQTPSSSTAEVKARSAKPTKLTKLGKDEARAKKPAASKAKPGPGAPALQKTHKKQTHTTKASDDTVDSRAVSEDPDPETIPIRNPDAVKHNEQWYWLMKAEPESRFENGIDVRFSIDDLRARTKPEGWDGIRAYAARNNLRAMNAGDMAFFYHSNCKTPGIAGTMEIVREHSEDKSARRPGSPYYDPSSTKANPRWSLVHVEFRRKFAVPIGLPELRELGKPGEPLENMQMLRQSRLSVSKVSAGEWKALCELADQKAKDAGLEHEDA